MDEKQLAKILSEDHAPEIDVNAKKRAVNLAVAEFKTAQSEKSEKSSQGISILSRLMGKGNNERGARTMEDIKRTKFIYGATATAMAVVLVGGLSLTQLSETVKRHEQNVSTVPSSSVVTPVPGTDEEVAPAYIEAVENVDPEELERALREAEVSVPAPIEAPDARLEVPEVEEEAQDSLHRWRRIQEERVDRSVEEPVGQKSQLGNRQDGQSAGAGAKLDDDGLADWKRSKNEIGDEVSQNKEGEAQKAGEAGALSGGLMKQNPGKDAPAPLEQWRRSDMDNAAPGRATASQEMDESLQSVAPKVKGKAEKKALDPSLRYNVPHSVTTDSIMPYPHPHPQPPVYQEPSRDQFEDFEINPFKQVTVEPVSTFSSDVDTASYSFVRKSLNNGRLPNPNSVRVEEMVNYFDYNYPLPESSREPFKPTVAVTDSPWAEGRKLMHVGIKGYQLEKTELRSNIVFLLDVSGSMNQPDKLPLVKSSMKMLLDSLHRDDTVSIVVYAGSTGVVLEPTKVAHRSTILNAIEHLRAGGSTAGAAGIRLAYDMAEQNFDKRAVNRVILATDGDFNVGITNRDELKRYIENKRDKGVFLSVLGFGQGNYNDALMQTLAQNGNGIAAYIDNLNEARKVLVEEATSALFPIAKDVKFQVEFNPDVVAEYRLIGYETRSLRREDFNNDKIDAGDMGAGHTVTAIYEFIPVGSSAVTVDPLRYTAKPEKKRVIKPAPINNEYAFLKIRYKLPTESKSKLITRPVSRGDDYSYCPANAACERRQIPQNVQFASAVAAFGQILKGGEHTGNFSYDDVIALAQNAKGRDPYGYRAEFINLVRLAKTLSR